LVNRVPKALWGVVIVLVMLTAAWLAWNFHTDSKPPVVRHRTDEPKRSTAPTPKTTPTKDSGCIEQDTAYEAVAVASTEFKAVLTPGPGVTIAIMRGHISRANNAILLLQQAVQNDPALLARADRMVADTAHILHNIDTQHFDEAASHTDMVITGLAWMKGQVLTAPNC
jgi:lipopolysaccharide export system protein LptC